MNPKPDPFGWTHFYEEMADKLRSFGDRRDELIDIVRTTSSRVADRTNLQDLYQDEEGICPFTVMGMFNRRLKDSNREIVANKLASYLGVSEPAPDSFAGVPFYDPKRHLFFVVRRSTPAR